MRFLTARMVLSIVPGLSAEQPKSPLPLFFFPNAGQADTSFRYLVATPHLSAKFRPESAVFQADGRQIAVDFVGATRGVKLDAVQPLAAKVNFFLGVSGWKTDVPSYGKIVYSGLYPGVDMTYGGTEDQLKSEFLVAPGADPDQIRLRYSEPVSIDREGNLLAGAILRDAAPEIYQGAGVTKVKISGRYRILDRHTVGFEIGPYDTSAPLVIDPTISYCTFLGGSNTTAITGVALDSSANLYVTGWTAALNFPIAGAFQAANQGGVDIIVAKLNAAGTALVYATYIGGSSSDKGAAIAVDNLGQAYVTGSTSSANFPLAFQNRSLLGGSTTAFALKLNSTGNSLLYSGYLGGTNYEVGTAIAVDANRNAYIAGDTQSANFPTKNPTQASIGGGTDAFVTILSPAGAITFSTFLGGAGNEHAGGIAVDSLGDIFVAGGTFSTNFPTLSPYQAANRGAQDAFLTKISFSGTIAFSTYLGGGGASEEATAIAVDSAGNPYLAGVTNSTNFPVTAGAFQTSLNGAQNVFVSKFTSNGQTLVYSTYLGGVGTDWASGIAVNSAGYAYVTGYTSSVNFPQAGAVQSTYNGLFDAFISTLNFAGNGLIFSTYYGGTGSDSSNAIALDTNGNIFIGGQTSSSDLHLVNPIESTSAASSTGWILRLGVTAPPPTTPSVTAVSPASGNGNTVSFTATYADTGGGSTLTMAALLVNTSASAEFACYVSYNPAMNLFSIYNDAGTAVMSTVTPGGAAAQNSQCALNGVGSLATVSANTLTVTYSITFQPPFPGSKIVYLLAADANSSTGWVAEGNYTVSIPVGTPTADSVSPNASSGSTQTFTFVYSDNVYAQNLTSVALLFNTTPLSFTNSCYVIFNPVSNLVSLTSDNGLSTTSTTLGSSTTLQNSQCSVGATSAATSGLSIFFSIAITFKGAFNGPKNIYLFAAVGALNTGWVLRGTFTVASGGAPAATSVVPGSGSGAGERFSFTITDLGGASNLTAGAMLFASTFNLVNACYLLWDGVRNTVSLTYDNPANGQTPFTPGTPGIATNSQCTMNAANSTVVVGATQVIITLDLTFNSSFFGPKTIFLFGSEAIANSGWTTVGSWTATGGVPTANSVSPASGSGTSPTFLFTVSDSSSQTNLTGVTMLITSGAPSSTASACYLVYNRTAATIGLWDDTGNTTLSTKGLGSSSNLLNSQCAVGYTVTTVSGTSITFSIQLVFFKPAFTGPKSVYAQANEPGANSGFVYLGTWTVQ